MSRRFIITADDYGMCDVVDKAIDDCIEAGLLTSTNVIVNMDDIDAVKTLRKRYPQISIGMHWNLTDGVPVCNTADIKTLVDPETGKFWKVLSFMKRFKKGLINKEEMRKELLAQYEIFQKYCGKADYWNVHENSSIAFSIFGVYNSLALELGITKTRNFQRVYTSPSGIPAGLKGKVVEFIKKIVFDIWFGHFVKSTGTKMPDGRMMYFNMTDKTSNIDNIGKNVRWGKKELVELVIHPATTADHPSFGLWRDVRPAEWMMFTDPKTKQYLAEQNIEIVTFDEVL